MEKVICKSSIDETASLVLNCLFIIPAVLIIIALIDGDFLDFSWYSAYLFFGGILLAIVIGVYIFALNSCSMVITDKRIYGKATFGQQVDLPIDMISAASIGLLKSVGVSTASGRISFWLLENKDELYSAITTLLMKRQQEKLNATIVATAPHSDEADQLKKFKDLLDSGIITQEEFDAKKKQLLGL